MVVMWLTTPQETCKEAKYEKLSLEWPWYIVVESEWGNSVLCGGEEHLSNEKSSPTQLTSWAMSPALSRVRHLWKEPTPITLTFNDFLTASNDRRSSSWAEPRRSDTRSWICGFRHHGDVIETWLLGNFRGKQPKRAGWSPARKQATNRQWFHPVLFFFIMQHLNIYIYINYVNVCMSFSVNSWIIREGFYLSFSLYKERCRSKKKELDPSLLRWDLEPLNPSLEIRHTCKNFLAKIKAIPLALLVRAELTSF